MSLKKRITAATLVVVALVGGAAGVAAAAGKPPSLSQPAPAMPGLSNPTYTTTSDSATVTWGVDGNGEPTFVYFEVCDYQSSAWPDGLDNCRFVGGEALSGASLVQYSYTITGLAPDTRFGVAVFALNRGGTNYSGYQSVVTLP